MKIAVYLSAVPGKAKNQSKRNLLQRFAEGAKAAGDEIWLVDNVDTVIAADIAVLQGWIGMKNAPHLEQRRRVIKQQRTTGNHTLVIDSNLFGFLAPDDRDRFLRYSLDGVFPTTGYYFDRDIDTARWREIAQSYGWIERDWQTTGESVLICLQRDGGWSMDGFSVVQWLAQVLPRIQQSSARPIVIRPHPGSLRVVPEIRQRWPSLRVSEHSDIRDDLNRAWCTITYNSSPAIASLLWGVPTFVTDSCPERSQAHGCANTNLQLIDNPLRFDRNDFYHRVAQCHFATANLANGQAWQFMRARLP